MGLVKAETTPVAPPIQRVLISNPFLATVLSIAVCLAVSVCHTQGKPLGKAPIQLHLQAVVERVSIAVKIANIPQRLNAPLRQGGIVDTLVRTAGLNIGIG